MDLVVLAIVGFAIAGGLFIFVAGCLLAWIILRRRERFRLTRISDPLGGFANPSEIYASRSLRRAFRRPKPREAEDSKKAEQKEATRSNYKTREPVLCGSPDSTTSSTRMMIPDDRDAAEAQLPCLGNGCPTAPIIEERMAANTSGMPSQNATPMKSAKVSKPAQKDLSSTPPRIERTASSTDCPWSAPPCSRSHPYESPILPTTTTRFPANQHISTAQNRNQRSENKPRSFSYPLKPKKKQHNKAHAHSILRLDCFGENHHSLPSPVPRDAKRKPMVFNGHEDWSWARIQRGVESKASVRPPLATQDSFRVSTDNTLLESNGSALSMSLVTANPTPVKGVEPNLSGGQSESGEMASVEGRLDRKVFPPFDLLPSMAYRSRLSHTEPKSANLGGGESDCVPGSEATPQSNRRPSRTDQAHLNYRRDLPQRNHPLQNSRQTHFAPLGDSDADVEDYSAREESPKNGLLALPRGPVYKGLSGNLKTVGDQPPADTAVSRTQADSPRNAVLQVENRDAQVEYVPRLNDELEGSYPPTPTKPAGARKSRTTGRPLVSSSTYLAAASNSSLTQRLSNSSWSSSRNSVSSPTFACLSDSLNDPFVNSHVFKKLALPPAHPPSKKPNGPRPLYPRWNQPQACVPGSETFDSPSASPRPHPPLSDAVNRLREMNSDNELNPRLEKLLKLSSSLSPGEGF